ncbi:bifunctional diaminohydroxyphosphoribosylaminopyrimidine deaminase/5-amino-6-(5-phosphoribosylamino)uracil reductase RibD [Dysgonomonas sp. 511]|uniref:bifunctional diaminohydroxyphosphoribosylaminopyrimidine deaminase/5-amino-6-(5-phosphoribosylamino)uracil reductase RibD n=1 Tax=Dysgonomonas sp. 511 TaxID=2302930 RepID=UPI0013D8AEB0|nr:bifunctional diaminohydroxyphosphoribosylaminopyrimidine deaminase/5-amino-6-(5-phosphoribosylamino)uracil reductase RibD [Dysgonomonas sp. 511]NDV79273.1 bifunctional diaminohydroxyphosphoribosylaminopyrimidine deaminase/5-amino-6-(5-phosphoribosylamino)uracil reductase RibD [Dysgonomonas sp. 511]
MTADEKYMQRCLQLAQNGRGAVSPNPMVGAVVVHNGKIVGEGYHRKYGEAHAEVNAIGSVEDKSLLKESTIYVSLEPCSHYGKTPPCAQLIIDSGIPRVVVACLDPYVAVSGRGVEMLKAAGVEVVVGILVDEAKELNKEFFKSQTEKRPYIYLKWAQTRDGYIDRLRNEGDKAQPTLISNNFSQVLVHKKRAEIDAIMIGTNTAVNDNPSLTTRFWSGKNPARVILDKTRRIPRDNKIFDGNVKTIVFTEKDEKSSSNVEFRKVCFDDNLLDNILSVLNSCNINSVLVEGGGQLLQAFISRDLWDEAYIEVSNAEFGAGIRAPEIVGDVKEELYWGTSKHVHLRHFDNYKIL